MDGEELRQVLEGHGVELPPGSKEEIKSKEEEGAVSPGATDDPGQNGSAANGNSQLSNSEPGVVSSDDKSSAEGSESS